MAVRFTARVYPVQTGYSNKAYVKGHPLCFSPTSTNIIWNLRIVCMWKETRM